jgi:hypothetical protein
MPGVTEIVVPTFKSVHVAVALPEAVNFSAQFVVNIFHFLIVFTLVNGYGIHFLFYRDLLNKDQTKKYELRENSDVGVYVKDLSSFVCKSVKEIDQVMYIGNQNRKIGYVCYISAVFM